jgi:hypothetical protein
MEVALVEKKGRRKAERETPADQIETGRGERRGMCEIVMREGVVMEREDVVMERQGVVLGLGATTPGSWAKEEEKMIEEGGEEEATTKVGTTMVGATMTPT